MFVIIIPAKNWINRLPNKNMALLNGRPMLDYAIDHALASERAGDIYVTADSDLIEAHSAGRGIQVIRRPESLGGDTPMVDVLNHAIDEINPEISVVVSVQPDHPDRTKSIDEAIRRDLARRSRPLAQQESSGIKNGAHHIMSMSYLKTGKARENMLCDR